MIRDNSALIIEFIRKAEMNLAARALDVAQTLYPQGCLQGANWCVGDIYGKPSRKQQEGTGVGSFQIRINGSRMGLCKDFANPMDKGHGLLECWMVVKGCPNRVVAAREALVFCGLGHYTVEDAASIPVLDTPDQNNGVSGRKNGPAPIRPFKEDDHLELTRRLVKNKAAMDYLMDYRGLTKETILLYRLGLSKPFENKDGKVSENALIYPLRNIRTGAPTGRFSYYNIPGVTVNPRADNGWTPGPPAIYTGSSFKPSHRIALLVEGMKDVWRHSQELRRLGLINHIFVMTSTGGSSMPEAIASNINFFDPFDLVYCCHDNDKAGRYNSASYYGHLKDKGRWASVPEQYGKDWTDYWKNGGSDELFFSLLKNAPPLSDLFLSVEREKEAERAEKERIREINRQSNAESAMSSGQRGGESTRQSLPSDPIAAAEQSQTRQRILAKIRRSVSTHFDAEESDPSSVWQSNGENPK